MLFIILAHCPKLDTQTATKNILNNIWYNFLLIILHFYIKTSGGQYIHVSYRYLISPDDLYPFVSLVHRAGTEEVGAVVRSDIEPHFVKLVQLEMANKQTSKLKT